MPDVDAEKVSVEPDGVSFMESLMARERGPLGLQNGFSPIEMDRSDSLGVGDTRAEDKEKATTPTVQICPVGLHKAVLLYPASAHSDTILLAFCNILLFIIMQLKVHYHANKI